MDVVVVFGPIVSYENHGQFSSRPFRPLAVSLEGSGPRPNGSVLDWHDTPSAFWEPSPTGGATI